MKSLAELQAIKDRMKDKVVLREGTSQVRVVVGMTTCGIAAGARPVLNAFVEGVSKEGLGGQVTVSQTGCIGICQYEPVVEIYEKDKEKVTYVKMTADKAREEVAVGSRSIKSDKFNIGAKVLCILYRICYRL